MSAQVTVTAKTGPNQQVTALVIPGVAQVLLDYDMNTIQVFKDGQVPPYKEFDMIGVTTVTDTITAGNHAIVIS